MAIFRIIFVYIILLFSKFIAKIIARGSNKGALIGAFSGAFILVVLILIFQGVGKIQNMWASWLIAGAISGALAGIIIGAKIGPENIPDEVGGYVKITNYNRALVPLVPAILFLIVTLFMVQTLGNINPSARRNYGIMTICMGLLSFGFTVKQLFSILAIKVGPDIYVIRLLGKRLITSQEVSCINLERGNLPASDPTGTIIGMLSVYKNDSTVIQIPVTEEKSQILVDMIEKHYLKY